MKKKANILFVILVIAFFLHGCEKTQKSPVIEYGEFPFRFTYEYKGEIFDIEDVVICEFAGYDYSSLFFTKPRSWREHLKSGTERISITYEENVYSILKPNRLNNSSEVYLDYGLGSYYMGENISSNTRNEPEISYIEKYNASPKEIRIESTHLSDEQLEKHFGIKVIEFTFSEPILNTFK